MPVTPSEPKWSSIPPQINSVAISDDGSRCVYGTSYERGSGDFFTFLYDGNGNLLWKQPIVKNKKTYQGVFWVAISGNGQFVASGGETVDTQVDKNNPTPGFLQAFDAATGTELLNITLSARINQVSLSQSGEYLAVCYGKTVEVFKLIKGIINPGEYKYSYEPMQQFTSATYDINSCVISRDGCTVVASGIAYSDDNTEGQLKPTSHSTATTTTGKVFSYTVNNSTVSVLGSCELTSGSMRVAVTDTGQYWTASLHDGSCMLFNQSNPNSEAWQCTPDIQNLMLAYAVDITQTDTGDVYVACGANLSGLGDGGVLYLVKSTTTGKTDPSEHSATDNAACAGVVQWTQNIQYGVNPGVSMDKNATYVTATDGKPDGQTINESAGSFYLFTAATGDLIWQKNTYMMNWPMMLSRDSSSVIGGSDDGSFYYWQAPYN
jgi:hypothetical protein